MHIQDKHTSQRNVFVAADPRARAYDNGTVLHWACRSEEGNRDLVGLLLKK